MKRIITTILLFICLINLSACNSSSDKWYEPKEISYLGQSKDNIITSLKSANVEYTDTNGITLSKPINIKGYDYFINFVFYQNKNISVNYQYKADTTSAEDTFDEIKNLASILTKKYGETYTDIVGLINQPTIASFDAYTDYLVKSQGLDCYDIWLLQPRENRISCTLTFSNNESGSFINICFSKKN